MPLIDTTIWSLALRRRPQDLTAPERPLIDEWARLVARGEAALIGPLRQEILSGIRSDAVFQAIRDQLDQFACMDVLLTDYDTAAEFYNTCRTQGIAGTGVDMLLCAVAARTDQAIFTTDADFTRYARCLPIHLYRRPIPRT